jgi:hypothetical protein
LIKLGMGQVPLYVTEFGWTTRPPGARDWIPAALRPRYITTTLTALGHIDCGVAASVLYTWVTPERNPAEREDWFGIHSPSGAATADSHAFAEGLRGAAGGGPALKLCGGAG